MSVTMIFATVMMTGLGCGVGCGSLSTPLLVGKMLGEARSKRGCMVATGVFSLGKILMYMALGVLAALFGSIVIEGIEEILPNIMQNVFRIVSVFFGLVIIRNAFKKDKCSTCKQCRGTNKLLSKFKDSSYFVIGLIYAVIPCSPLIIALTYAAGMDPVLASILMLCFGVVNSIFSVVIYAPIVGTIIGKMQEEIPQYYKWIQVFAALMFMWMALLGNT